MLIKVKDIFILDESVGELRFVVWMVKLKYGDIFWLSFLLVWEINLVIGLIEMYFVVLLIMLNFILVFMFIFVFLVEMVKILVFFGDFLW